MDAFSKSQFKHFPLIWMCLNTKNSNKVNRVHERCLEIIYNDKQSSLNALLYQDSSIHIYETILNFWL